VPDGLKPKDLVGIPWRVAFALQADGWYLRSDIIWAKPNPMPESVTDRPTKAHEMLFLLAKSERYHYDAEAIKEPATDTGRANGRDGRVEDLSARPPNSSPRTLRRLDYSQRGRNKRSVWTIPTEPFPEAHFATFPQALIEPCIKAGCPAGGTVLDPFAGSGTTGLVAKRYGCRAVLIELNAAYCAIAARRLAQGVLELTA
jgi:DNA modification methylase